MLSAPEWPTSSKAMEDWFWKLETGHHKEIREAKDQITERDWRRRDESELQDLTHWDRLLRVTHHNYHKDQKWRGRTEKAQNKMVLFSCKEQPLPHPTDWLPPGLRREKFTRMESLREFNSTHDKSNRRNWTWKKSDWKTRIQWEQSVDTEPGTTKSSGTHLRRQ